MRSVALALASLGLFSLQVLAQDCPQYAFPQLDRVRASYPEPGTIADLKNADNATMALFNRILPDIPKIARKSAAALTAYAAADPDCWWTYNKCTEPKLPGLADDVFTCPSPKTAVLTIDDGPMCNHDEYYDFLKENKFKATMFYIGGNVLNWPRQAQRGLEDGHEICLHSWSHHEMTYLTNEQAFAELYYAKKILHDVMGITTQCWRPPYGDVDDRIRYIASRLGLATIIWDTDTDDWRITNAGGPATVRANYEKIVADATAGLFNRHGTVILSHENSVPGMKISMEFLARYEAVFEQVVPIATCHNNSFPYLEKDFQYPNILQWIRGIRNFPMDSPKVKLSAMAQTPATGAQGMANVEYGGEIEDPTIGEDGLDVAQLDGVGDDAVTRPESSVLASISASRTAASRLSANATLAASRNATIKVAAQGGAASRVDAALGLVLASILASLALF